MYNIILKDIIYYIIYNMEKTTPEQWLIYRKQIKEHFGNLKDNDAWSLDFKCMCGKTIMNTNSSIAMHVKTKRHMTWILQNQDTKGSALTSLYPGSDWDTEEY